LDKSGTDNASAAGSLVRFRELGLFVAACALYAWRRAPFLGQWDSFDYLKQTVTHQLSPLAAGRPVFVGYNILLWEFLRGLFRLDTFDVEWVMSGAVIVAGGIGVVLFGRLARRILPGPGGWMATLALLLSPTYTAYAGSVMTEIPMFAVAAGAACILWAESRSRTMGREVAAGVVWGLAVGIREQALVFFGAYVWILWLRRRGPAARVRSIAAFSVATAIVVAAPVLTLYCWDPAAFQLRMAAWLKAIPTGESHFWLNYQATIVYTVAACPGPLLALAGAALMRKARRDPAPRDSSDGRGNFKIGRSMAAWGVFWGLVLPLAVLWRDADVQIHPRYVVVALAGVLIPCTALYRRLAPSRNAVIAWAALQVVAFVVAQIVVQPFREVQSAKRDYARFVYDKLPGPALLVPGGLSPVFDYYRAVGLRPEWQVAWSGWDWDTAKLETRMRQSWRAGIPVYVCDGPSAWLNLEGERFELEFLLFRCAREQIAPGLTRIDQGRNSSGWLSFSGR
jgi:hypothetical protein